MCRIWGLSKKVQTCKNHKSRQYAQYLSAPTACHSVGLREGRYCHAAGWLHLPRCLFLILVCNFSSLAMMSWTEHASTWFWSPAACVPGHQRTRSMSLYWHLLQPRKSGLCRSHRNSLQTWYAGLHANGLLFKCLWQLLIAVAISSFLSILEHVSVVHATYVSFVVFLYIY